MSMTIQDFNDCVAGAVFAQGITTNDPTGAYMTNHRMGEQLRWVAVKGNGNDWCIYCLWADQSTFKMVETNGDKIRTKEYILNLVPCEEEVYKLYRK